MARYVYEGKTDAWWVTTIANKAAPTVAEINAGTNLTNFVAKDGVATNFTNNKVDSASIAETFNAQLAGSFGSDLELTMFRDDTADTAWNLWVQGTNGFVVLRRAVASGAAVAAAQKVEVFPAQMLEPTVANSAQDTQVRFTGGVAVTSAPNQKATIAA
jgi:hypothetical protein